MKNFRSLEMKIAYKKACFRERYAMENGNRSTIIVNGHKCYKFTYSKDKKYQDANGALYDTITKSWRD